MIVDAMPLMRKYLGDGKLSNDEREILLFALYLESLQRTHGIAYLALKALRVTGAAKQEDV